MIFDLRMWRPAPLLAEGPAQQRLRLASLVGLALLIALVAMSGTAAWRSHPPRLGRTGGEITVTTHGAALESSDAAAARAVEILNAIRGVSRVRVQDSEVPTAQGWPPRRIDLTVAASNPALIGTITAQMQAEGLSVEIDDHGPLTGHIERTVVLILGITFVVGTLMAILATRLITFWPGLRVTSSPGVIDVMRQCGADRSAFVREVRRGLTAPVFVASVSGTALGAAVWLTLAACGPAPDVLAGIAAAPVDLIAAMPWPFAAFLVAEISAQWVAGSIVRARS